MELIPAIDIIDGKCVRLEQGDYSKKKIYNNNPVEIALMFEGAGIKRLHLVDLDGAAQKKIVNYKVIETIARKTSLIIDFGGGLKSDNDLRIAFESGASMITGGSIAVKDIDVFTQWIDKYGSEKVILGADVKGETISIAGWKEESDWNIIDFIKFYQSKGIIRVISTDIAKDGMLLGPSYELYNKLNAEFPDMKFIASGGVTSMDDLFKLKEDGLDGAIIGKAFYEGLISLKDLENWNEEL